MPATFAVVGATALGLLIGGLVPGITLPSMLVLALIFVQTIMGAGALADGDLRIGHDIAWLRRVLMLHLFVASAPLWLLGLLLGLDTSLGAGAFILGSAPPAIGLPTYVAACRGDVRAAVHATSMGYSAAVVITPCLLFVGFGSTNHLGTLALTLLVGLIAPLAAAIKLQPQLRRIPRPVSFGIICGSIVALMTALGAVVREVFVDPQTALGSVALAVSIGVLRCVVSAAAGGWLGGNADRRIESALAVGTKNSVLAAVIASTLVSPLAAVAAIANAVAELVLVVACSAIQHRRQNRSL